MKKNVLGLLAVITFLVACGNAESKSNTETQSTTEETTAPAPQSDTISAPAATDTSLKINVDTV